MPSTKIEFNCHKILKINDLDELASLLFPGNRNQQRIFLSIFIELKYAPDCFLPTFNYTSTQYKISPRSLELVRSKMRRMGLIDHVSRFNAKYGYREGWIFSSRFTKCLEHLSVLQQRLRTNQSALQKRKDQDLFRYL